MINVLLSTYNGEKYLKELIDSILSQKDAEVDILVRDDSSTDSETHNILDTYQREKKLTWYKGKNIKPAQSFMQLLRDSHETDFYAFADQDDIWLPDKLSSAINAISQYNDRPALYFSRTQLTDANLKAIKGPLIKPLLTFGESLVYKFIPGCTMVFNKKLRDIVNLYIPQYIPMHDIWIYSIALAVNAKIVFDEKPHILYRQHGDNTIGQGQGCLHEWKRRINRLRSGSCERYNMAVELKKGYWQLMGKNEREILAAFIDAKHSLKKRIQLANDKRFKCSDMSTYRLFKLSVLLNAY